MNEYAGVTEWTGGIPVELPVEVVRSYIQAETLTLERFNLLQAYFEGRIIKLLEDNWPEDIPSKLDDYWSGYEAAFALIKGEQK